MYIHHKNPYSLQGFEPGTYGFVVWFRLVSDL
jgi:hypothetical protein